MIKVKSKIDRFYNCLDYIFPAYFVVYFVEFYFGLWGLSTIIKLLCILLAFFYALEIYKRATQNCIGFRQLFTIYYLYVICSGLMYLFNGVPFQCYLNEIYNSIPAMFFVYVGMAEPERDNSFYKKFLISCSICMGIGLILYVTTPGWFINRRMEILSNAAYVNATHTEETMLESMRFSSYLIDTYETDMFAMIALSIAFFMYYLHIGKSNFINLLLVFVNYLAAMMTQQRVAMVAASAVVLYYMFKGKKQQSSTIMIVAILASFLFVVFVVANYGDRVGQLEDLLLGRMDNMSLSKAFSERDYQLKLITEHWTMPVFGHGAGAGGAIAGSFRLPHVNDAAYLELLFEYGVMGSFLFLLVVIKTIKRGIKNVKFYMIELVIIAFVLVAMLGSNTLTMGFMTIFPFWYSVGRIWNKEHHQYIITNNVRI